MFGIARLLDLLGIVEIRRRILHMTPGILAIVIPFVPRGPDWLLVILIVLFTMIGLFVATHFRRFFIRPGEQTWRWAVLGYAIPVVAPIVLFPAHAEFGLMTLEIVALGDGSATLVGRIFSGPHLPWNENKTIPGLICFTGVGALTAAWCYWQLAVPPVALGTAVLICGVAALSAGIAESLPIQANDNFRVGLTALLSGSLMSLIV